MMSLNGRLVAGEEAVRIELRNVLGPKDKVLERAIQMAVADPLLDGRNRRIKGYGVLHLGKRESLRLLWSANSLRGESTDSIQSHLPSGGACCRADANVAVAPAITPAAVNTGPSEAMIMKGVTMGRVQDQRFSQYWHGRLTKWGSAYPVVSRQAHPA